MRRPWGPMGARVETMRMPFEIGKLMRAHGEPMRAHGNSIGSPWRPMGAHGEHMGAMGHPSGFMDGTAIGVYGNPIGST